MNLMQMNVTRRAGVTLLVAATAAFGCQRAADPALEQAGEPAGEVLEQAQTQGQAAEVDVASLGPQVGERVPAFAAVDQEGREQSLGSILGPRGAMLVFNRSADW